ncbi:MAG: proline--tRNA ligase [Anaerolineae bacterium]
MRLSRLFSRTLRDAPADAEWTSHALLTRAGMIRPLAAGLYVYLPLGWAVMRRIQDLLVEAMDAIGGQEMRMPLVTPAELWQRSGRWYEVGPELVRVRDRVGRDLVLAMTHEETATEMARHMIRSYRDLPALIYQIETKMRDEPRPRAGLVRMREFLMQDAYSFHSDADDLDAFFGRVRHAYHAIFRRVDLQPLEIAASSGLMGGSDSIEFILPHHLGEDQFVQCADCAYAAHVDVAVTDKGSATPEAPLALETVDTPGADTIADLAALLDIPAARIAKSVWYTAESEKGLRLVVALIRGDLDVDERRLAALVRSGTLRLATAQEMAAVGAVPGYASTIGIDRAALEDDEARLMVVVDDTIPASPNLVAGANRPDLHYRNVNYGRDFTADIIADISLVRDGDPCARCGAPLSVRRGVELAQIFKLGTHYSEPMGATYLDRQGVMQPLVMGSYGLGLDRLMAAIVEAHHDSHGICWPAAVAPADVHLVALKLDDGMVRDVAEALYARLRAQGQRVLYDDRDESPGIKFADADLIGAPVRVTVSQRSLRQGGVEVKPRREGIVETVSLDDLSPWLEAWQATP